MEGIYVATAILREGLPSQAGEEMTTASLFGGRNYFYAEPPTVRLAQPLLENAVLVVGVYRAGAHFQTLPLVIREVEPDRVLIGGKDWVLHDETIAYTELEVLLAFKEEGLHWYEVTLGGALLTRIPVLVRFVRRASEPD